MCWKWFKSLFKCEKKQEDVSGQSPEQSSVSQAGSDQPEGGQEEQQQ